MKHVFLFEYISGGGIKNSSEFEFLIPEGFSMLSSLIKDFSLFGIHIHTLIDERIAPKFLQTHSNEIKNQIISYVIIPKGEEIQNHLQKIVTKVDYVLCIAPEFSNILYNLIAFFETSLKSHQLLLSLPSSAILLFTDKLMTESFLHSSGFCAPHSIKLDLETVKNIPKSKSEYIIKPFDGVGASDTYCIPSDLRKNISSVFDAIQKRAPHQHFIIQKKQSGIALSAFIGCQDGQLSFLIFNTQNIKYHEIDQLYQIHQLEYSGGSTPYTDLPPDMEKIIRDIATAISSQFDFTGFFGLDFVFDISTNTYSIVDINPRVTTPYIAISELFRENHSNILECLFGKFSGRLIGKKEYVKTDQREISLN
ncbi:MAG: ATP-grasp domain-containing protein [Candidatus Lokiarchaeota archaeon]|nr:ATP-grasp domain-containing protein [Candidatus Lokiarchaeota archaeon]